MELFIYLPYIFTENHWRYTTGKPLAIFRATIVFFEKMNEGNIHGTVCVGAFRPATLLKRDSNTDSGIFILGTFIIRVLTEPDLGPAQTFMVEPFCENR